MIMLHKSEYGRGLRKAITRFRREEDGSVIVLTLFLLVLMLILGGMAVDFMRFESRRAKLQGVTDRAVLAAADLDQELDPAAVVADYFAKAGMASYLDGPAEVSPPSTEYREVTAKGKMTLNTFFLRLIGTDTLTARSASTAIEGVGNIEVSLVVDVSGSMREVIPGVSPTTTRIERLRQASTAFVNTLLAPEYVNKVSLSLVPYSEHVNAGPEIFNRLNTIKQHDFSYCLEFPASAYSETIIDDSPALEQVQHFQSNPAYDTDKDGEVDEGADWYWGIWLSPAVNQPVCPQQTFEQIVPLTQNKTTLTNNIAKFHPRSGTSIFLGLKWGVALLDPTFNDIYTDLPSSMRDAAFMDRPSNYTLPTEAASGATKKYVVLMSDGQNDNSNRLQPEKYDDPSEIAHWAEQNLIYSYYREIGSVNISNWRYQKYTAAIGDQYMDDMCAEAKKPEHNIIIYAIAMGTDSNATEDARGKQQLRDCSSGPSFYYETSGAELVQIFEDIAKQITDLRLTQ